MLLQTRGRVVCYLIHRNPYGIGALAMQNTFEVPRVESTLLEHGVVK
jgi:hypothetical protein